MKKHLVAMAGLVFGLAVAAGCAGAAPASPPTPTMVADTEELTAECFHTEAEPLPLTYDVLNEPTPTGIDGRNSASCRFSRPISKVSVILTNEDGPVHTEAFHLEPPVHEVRFPLPRDLWTFSEKTLELLAPGEYERRIVASAEDGDTWDVTANIRAALKTVTVVDSTENTPTPTPSAAKEWDLQGVHLDGSIVTVSLHVFAGIDVQVTLGGEEADEVRLDLPMIEYVFRDVPPGRHTVEVRDVVGHRETAGVAVAAPGIPEWLSRLIQKLENEPLADPPLSVIQYRYEGRMVYYVPPRCCDIFSDLYDADGNVIARPEGGITGKGDGRAPEFSEQRRDGKLVWKDPRRPDPSLVQTLAPIERVEVLILESFPVQYRLLVASGLPNACYSFAGYRLDRGGDTVRVEIVNYKPTDPQAVCAQVYGTVETNISIGVDFEPGTVYSVVVNDVTETFVAQ